MARPLAESFAQVVASDIHDYGHGGVYDFLGAGSLLEEAPPIADPDWIITNPPFNRAAEFALRAAEVAREGFALLVRTSFLEGAGHHESLFSKHPPEWILQFCERVPMVKGRLDQRATTATGYAWFVWNKKADGEPRLVWIPPCRRSLERRTDYPGSSNMSNGRQASLAS